MVGKTEISLIVLFERRPDGSYAARIDGIANLYHQNWDKLSADLDARVRESFWYLSGTAPHRFVWTPSLETVRHRLLNDQGTAVRVSATGFRSEWRLRAELAWRMVWMWMLETTAGLLRRKDKGGKRP